ncbi:MAG: uroporphyrinogen decarboxylase family protein [Lentisphaeria bacterium]|nr:uroporphyrinogen decarboxylase family protein [Lentisphaeria bacterium]
MTNPTNKERLQILLDGGIPDVPPTWELVFQIQEEFFGMAPRGALRDMEYASEEDMRRALWQYDFEVYERCVEELGWGAIRGGYDPEEVRFHKDRINGRALVVGYEGEGVFYMPNGDTMMDFAVRLYEDPKGIQAEAREKCDKAKETFRRHVDAGADLLLGTWDMGFNTQPFCSPEKFEEIVVPYMTELVEYAHGLGKKLIVHSDGCLTPILDQIHKTGIDGYQSVDPQGCMDIKAVRDHYPDWLLMGNVACNMLQDTNDEKIRESVRYCMNHGGVGKPYIFSTSNCIFKGMPVESYKIMLDEYRLLCGAAQSTCD